MARPRVSHGEPPDPQVVKSVMHKAGLLADWATSSREALAKGKLSPADTRSIMRWVEHAFYEFTRERSPKPSVEVKSIVFKTRIPAKFRTIRVK